MTKGAMAKRARDLARIKENRGRMVRIESSDDDENASPPAKVSSHTQAKKKKKSQSRSSVQITNGDFDGDDAQNDEDELGDHSQRANTTRKSKTKPNKTFKDLAAAAKFLSEMDSVTDIEEFLQVNGLHTDEDVASFAEKCGTISRLLRSKSEPGKDATVVEIPGAVETYDMIYMLRDGSCGMKLLAPIEVFHANTAIKNKVIGFVRLQGKYWPLIFAISGSKIRIPGHPRLLDSELWTQLVLKWGDDFGHLFRTNGWEGRRGVTKGTDFASHVEPKLMLWFACKEWTKLSKRTLSLDKQIKMLFELQDLKQKVTVEIVQDRLPCDCCLKFQKRLQKFTGYKLRFKFVICPNVGVMESVFNKHGAKVNQLPDLDRVVDVEEEDEDENENEEGQSMHRIEERHLSYKKSSFAVVIRSSPQTLPQEPELNRHADTPKPRTVTETCTVTQRDRIRSFSYQSTSSAPGQECIIEIDSDTDESDYQPPTRTSRSKGNLSQFSTPPKPSKTTGLPTPSSGIFPDHALRKAAELKTKQRKRKYLTEDSSPSVAKKYRHTRL